MRIGTEGCRGTTEKKQSRKGRMEWKRRRKKGEEIIKSHARHSLTSPFVLFSPPLSFFFVKGHI